MTAAKPLSNVSAVELGDGVGVSLAGLVLREMGATVTKVTGFTDADTDDFRILNRGKRLIGAWDADVNQLLAESAVVLSGPSWNQRVAAAWEGMEDAPVWSSIEAGGQLSETPLPTDTLLAEAESGVIWLQQGLREGPFCMVSPIAGYGAGLVAALGAVLGLVQGVRGGGQPYRCSVSHVEGAYAMNMHSTVFHGSEAPVMRKVRDPYSVAGTPLIHYFQVQDGWVLIFATTQRHWTRVCLLIGRPDFLADERLAGAPMNVTDPVLAAEIVEAISSFIRLRTVADVVETFREAGLSATKVLSHEEFLHHPQVRINGLAATVMGPDSKESTIVGNFVKFTPLRQSVPKARPAAPSINGAASDGPLRGLRVTEVCTFVAAPLSCRVLADHGAEVVKIEPLDGDSWRSMGLSFSAVNAGKRSLALNIEPGSVVLKRLLETSDILVCNLSPAASERLGLTAAQVTEVNDRAVVLNIHSWGTEGPLSGLPAIDAAIQAISGGALAQGGGHGPMGHMGGSVDNVTGWLSATVALASLYARESTGTVFAAETALLNSGAVLQLRFLIDPKQAGRAALDPLRLGYSSFQRLYEAKDGWLCVAANDPQQREAFAECVKRRCEGYALESEVDADSAASRLFRTRTLEEWRTDFESAGFTAWRVARTLEEVARAAMPPLVPMDQPPWGRLSVVDRLPRTSAGQKPLVAAPVKPGSHSREVLLHIGFTSGEIDELAAKRTIVEGDPSAMAAKGRGKGG